MGRDPFVAVVAVSRIVVVAVSNWVVRTIVVIVATSVNSVVGVVRLLIYPNILFAFYVKQFFF